MIIMMLMMLNIYFCWCSIKYIQCNMQKCNKASKRYKTLPNCVSFEFFISKRCQNYNMYLKTHLKSSLLHRVTSWIQLSVIVT